MTTARNFARELDRWIPTVEARLGRGMIRFAEIAREMIASRTPIDTGRASASWNASLNGANLRVQPPEYFNPGAPWQDGEVNVGQFLLGDSIHISNSLDYVKFLNAGTSRKAPRMFVEKEFRAAARMLPRILHVTR